MRHFKGEFAEELLADMGGGADDADSASPMLSSYQHCAFVVECERRLSGGQGLPVNSRQGAKFSEEHIRA